MEWDSSRVATSRMRVARSDGARVGFVPGTVSEASRTVPEAHSLQPTSPEARLAGCLGRVSQLARRYRLNRGTLRC